MDTSMARFFALLLLCLGFAVSQGGAQTPATTAAPVTAAPASGGNAVTAAPAPGGNAVTAAPAPGGNAVTVAPAQGGNVVTPALGGPTAQPAAVTTTPKPYNCSQGTCNGTFDCVKSASKLASCTVRGSSGGCSVKIANGTVILACAKACDTARNSGASWCCQTNNCNKQRWTPPGNNSAIGLVHWRMVYTLGLVFWAFVTVS